MKFERIKVYNFENAFRGMRNPKNSWARSDSIFGLMNHENEDNVNLAYDVADKWAQAAGFEPGTLEHEYNWGEYTNWLLKNGTLEVGNNCSYVAYIGPKDMKLAQTLIRGGSEHRKFMRQIFVTVDITAPLYWWKEFDTYKVGTVANSTSTMHKLAETPITLDCFETDDYNPDLIVSEGIDDSGDTPYDYHYPVTAFIEPSSDTIPFYFEETLINFLETLRQKYNETKDTRYWKELIRWLPESWLQTRTVTMNYENLIAISHQRKNHKLTEWSESFMSFVKNLPYADDLILLGGD